MISEEAAISVARRAYGKRYWSAEERRLASFMFTEGREYGERLHVSGCKDHEICRRVIRGEDPLLELLVEGT